MHFSVPINWEPLPTRGIDLRLRRLIPIVANRSRQTSQCFIQIKGLHLASQEKSTHAKSSPHTSKETDEEIDENTSWQ